MLSKIKGVPGQSKVAAFTIKIRQYKHPEPIDGRSESLLLEFEKL